ncbi:SURF1 family protein [Sphingomonas parva]|uniref:SURF1-like protein n=1 Tax=Sphingomonas parva TaxID=2555898 RepID=A0A4Y8ZSB7_9SPHN|nr:SURF1 family protein [Sphingomonas parva]TFI58911.1 SURF1 family protein [Sphingomonas parva]
MKRWPLIPTLVVAAAVLTMIGLGIWQLRRSEWKQALIARFESNRSQPPVAWPVVPPADDSLLYRRAKGFCLQPVAWRAIAGRNLADEPGWSHIASCRTGGAEGPGMEVDIGWSRSGEAPAWRGGEVNGIIVPDSTHRIRLVAQAPAAGLQASRPPSPSETPNNHLAYALQWFFFAATAAVIYVLALRRRREEEPKASKA